MDLTLITVPYHLGRPGEGAGGPAALLDAGLEHRLRDEGHDVQTEVVSAGDHGDGDLGRILHVDAALARLVREAAAAGRFPVVLSADCNVALGVAEGLGACSTAVVWFDAHGDFNTPETTPSGYLDGMPLAMLVGRCFTEEIGAALGGPRVPEEHVLHVGARDLDPGERRGFAGSPMMAVAEDRLAAAAPSPAQAIWPALAGLRHGHSEHGIPAGEHPDADRAAHVQTPAELPLERPHGLSRAYVHVDIDVLDPRYAPAVDFPVEDGLSPDDLLDCITAVHALLPLCALSVSAFDPDRPDPDGRTRQSVVSSIVRSVDAAAAAPPARPSEPWA